MPESDVAASIKKTLRHLVLVVIALCVVTTIVDLYFWQDSNHKTSEIQQERKNSILRSCQDQNIRHDLTIKFFDDQIAKLPKKEREAAKAQRATTILFISALAPKRDCDKLVAQSVGGG